ncbi:hypothetical protein DIPPA_04515 [Diplonema papillatum]|nr:hypothetical protein DIPPA_04515 [Diplonema papillatum]
MCVGKDAPIDGAKSIVGDAAAQRSVRTPADVVRAGGHEILKPEAIRDMNAGRAWWQKQGWNFPHTPAALEHRRQQSLGVYPYENTYFSGVYDRHGLVPHRGKPRKFPQPHPLEVRGRYGTLSFEGRVCNALMEAYLQGKMIRVGYFLALGSLAYLAHYATRVDSVELPADFKKLDTLGTGCSHAVKFFLPDFKLLNVEAVNHDSYLKKYTASVFSCWGHYPVRKFVGLYDVAYYCRAYHLHYRRNCEVSELFTDYRILEKTRSTALLQSELFGTLVHCHAEVGDDGCLILQLSTILPKDHWTQQWHGSFIGDSVVGPMAKTANFWWTRLWMTSSCNFFLRHHCSEVYVKPLSSAQNLTFMDSLA